MLTRGSQPEPFIALDFINIFSPVFAVSITGSLVTYLFYFNSEIIDVFIF